MVYSYILTLALWFSVHRARVVRTQRSTQPNHPIYLLLHPAIYQYLKIGRFYTGRLGGAWCGAAGARGEF